MTAFAPILNNRTLTKFVRSFMRFRIDGRDPVFSRRSIRVTPVSRRHLAQCLLCCRKNRRSLLHKWKFVKFSPKTHARRGCGAGRTPYFSALGPKKRHLRRGLPARRRPVRRDRRHDVGPAKRTVPPLVRAVAGRVRTGGGRDKGAARGKAGTDPIAAIPWRQSRGDFGQSGPARNQSVANSKSNRE